MIENEPLKHFKEINSDGGFVLERVEKLEWNYL